MGRNLVIGDIHGAYEALLQVMNRSGFDYENDRLICLGDIADRRSRVKECVDALLGVKNLVMLLGNHDLWMLEWMNDLAARSDDYPLSPKRPVAYNDNWYQQGGKETVWSYRDGVTESHYTFFRNAGLYHLESNRLFVHGGIDQDSPVESQAAETLLWDRSLVRDALKRRAQDVLIGGFREIYVGHTPTINFIKGIKNANAFSPVKRVDPERKNTGASHRSNADIPVKLCNVWLMDTGAAWPGGRLSMMDIDTKEVWQSDTLY